MLFPEGELSIVTGPTARQVFVSSIVVFNLSLLSLQWQDGLTCKLSLHATTDHHMTNYDTQIAVLGEMTLLNGRIIMAKDRSRIDEYGNMHAISYAAQAPWLRHQSIKDNILFGYPLDEERYEAVLECCALKPDLAMLEDGDTTEIGARGVSLSGGQKAR